MNARRLLPTNRGWSRLRLTLFLAGVILVLVPVAAVAVNGFTDVPAGHPHAEGIGWIADKGITIGYGDNTYRPDNPVTRGQMATFLHRNAGVLVAAGATVNVPVIIAPGAATGVGRWFNNVNGTQPTFTKNGDGEYTLDFGFDVTDRYVQVTASPTGLFILGSAPAVRWATASVSGTSVNVWTYRWDGGGVQPVSADSNIQVLVY